MKKIVDYIKAHPCITIVHMLGVLMVILCFFFEPWAATGARNFLSIGSGSVIKKIMPAGALSFLGLERYSSAHKIDKERGGTGFLYFLKGVFYIFLWFFVYYLVSWMLYRFGYYSYSRLV